MPPYSASGRPEMAVTAKEEAGGIVRKAGAGRTVRQLKEAGKRLGLWRNGYKFVNYCQSQLFAGIDLRGKSVLDIGCGSGMYLIWASVNGASRLVGLEPLLEGSGSSRNTEGTFKMLCGSLGLKNIERLPHSLQEYRCDDGSFDIVLSHASINHLDEDMCMELKTNPRAREAYLEMFKKIRRMMKEGGRLIVVDATNRNVFSDLGMRDFLHPKLNVLKHQDPAFWSRLLTQAGFGEPQISWLSRPSIGPLGVLLRNRPMNYLLGSSFRLEMTAQ
jgi:SAM-dependent methyltransferase